MFSGGGDDGLAARLGIVPPSLLNHTTPSLISPEISTSLASREERGPSQPQWSQQETMEFIAIRAELERDFTASKRTKTLWEVVSSKMRERGFRRSPEQCKCKWKNLVNRYKGKETSDPEHGRHCPFFEELHAIFTQRAHNMQRLLLESETRSTQPKKVVKRVSGDRSSEEFSEDDDEVAENSDDEKPARSNTRKRKVDKVAMEKYSKANNPSNSLNNTTTSVQEMLKEFFQHQLRMEMQWREMMERRAHERELFEQEWRQSMEKLERERLMIEHAWREREEQRRIREESRAERRDALLTTLLNKLIHESN
ncbi:PREDICTED: trihelix transcription factor GT-3b-like [Lupinus angustifolius]|uniref:trihelix transcription factor GT-3b-like n=1 Tax=Lupinus angustifolius TaxID=3871 RepID=UPI00092E3441|nr:PREDICTED: trihelix transcription factor GT-3b-like [Lupinus angustifolius]